MSQRTSLSRHASLSQRASLSQHGSTRFVHGAVAHCLRATCAIRGHAGLSVHAAGMSAMCCAGALCVTMQPWRAHGAMCCAGARWSHAALGRSWPRDVLRWRPVGRHATFVRSWRNVLRWRAVGRHAALVHSWRDVLRWRPVGRHAALVRSWRDVLRCARPRRAWRRRARQRREMLRRVWLRRARLRGPWQRRARLPRAQLRRAPVVGCRPQSCPRGNCL